MNLSPEQTLRFSQFTEELSLLCQKYKVIISNDNRDNFGLNVTDISSDRYEWRCISYPLDHSEYFNQYLGYIQWSGDRPTEEH